MHMLFVTGFWGESGEYEEGEDKAVGDADITRMHLEF